MIWEIALNSLSHLNLAIMYTFGGHFDLAKQVLNKRIVFLYLLIYAFSLWDSYRATISLNKQYVMADREDAHIKPFYIDPFEINYLDKRNPTVACLWSLFVPGLGQLMTHRLIAGCFNLLWWVVGVYMSHGLEGLWLTVNGHFTEATRVLDPQWTLFLPSMYGFAAYDAYCTTVESNKLFEKEQSKFLRTN